MEASIIMGVFDNFYDFFRDELENAIENFNVKYLLYY